MLKERVARVVAVWDVSYWHSQTWEMSDLSPQSGLDPNVWSGRAVQEALSTWMMRSCINVSGLCLERVVLRAIMDISAHASSLPVRPRLGH